MNECRTRLKELLYCMLREGGGATTERSFPAESHGFCSRCSRLLCAIYARSFGAEDLPVVESFDDE